MKNFLKIDYIYFLAITRSFFKSKNFLKYFGFIYLLYFIGFFNLLTNDILHKDDVNRFNLGYTNYHTDGRILSDFLSYIFNMNYPKIFYISPLTQLIAIAFLSLASMALVKIVNKKISYWGLVASLAVGLSPFYLELMSFKFDSPCMALATLCAILPFLFIRRLSLFFVVSVIFLLFMWNLYQTNNGIYIILSMFITLNLILQKADLKQIFKFISISALAFIFSVIIYKFAIIPLTCDLSGYTKFVSKTITSFEELKLTINQFIFRVDLWTGSHIIRDLFFISCILFLIVNFYKNKINPIFTIFFIAIFIFFGFFATFGIYYAFSNLNYEPRLLSNLGIFSSILLISITNAKIKILNHLTKIFTLIFTYNLILISILYFNATKIQANYVDFRINQAINFIESNFVDKNYKIQLSKYNYAAPIHPRLGENDNVGLHPNVLKIANNIPTLRSTVIYGMWFHHLHKQKNINLEKCVQNDKKPIKILNTKLNKFEIFENDCIILTYKKLPDMVENPRFNKNIVKYKKHIFDTNLGNNLKLSLSHNDEKLNAGSDTIIFEFNQKLSNIVDKGDTILSIHFDAKERGYFVIDKPIKNYNTLNDKFYYIVGLENIHINNISQIKIGFFNKKTKKFSQRFLLDLKELNKK